VKTQRSEKSNRFFGLKAAAKHELLFNEPALGCEELSAANRQEYKIRKHLYFQLNFREKLEKIILYF